MQRYDLRHLNDDFYDRMGELMESGLVAGEVGIFLFEVGDFSSIQKSADFIKESGHDLMNSLKFNEVDWTLVVKKVSDDEIANPSAVAEKEAKLTAQKKALAEKIAKEKKAAQAKKELEEKRLAEAKAKQEAQAKKELQVKKETPVKNGYFIQVGSFTQTPRARFLSVIKNSGFSYKITPASSTGTKKLLIGPYASRAEVDTALVRVRDRINKSAFVVKK